jgi:hypothetical protein
MTKAEKEAQIRYLQYKLKVLLAGDKKSRSKTRKTKSSFNTGVNKATGSKAKIKFKPRKPKRPQ